MFSKFLLINGLLQGSLATLGPMCCGDNFCCNLNDKGAMTCWGGNSFTAPTGTYKALACHGKAGVGIDSSMKISNCFGTDNYGAKGCTTGTEIIDAAMGFWGGCAIKKSDKSIFCWGPTTVYGTNSRPTESECTSMYGASKCSAVTATLTPPSGTYETIACGGKRAGHFCCAVDTSKKMNCFGAGSSGSTYTPASSKYPSESIKQLSCGTDFCCGLDAKADMKCFGNLAQGDDTTGTDIPASLTGPFVQVSCGNFAVYVLHKDSTVSAYGRVFKSSVGPVAAKTSTIELPFSKGWTSLPTNAGFSHGCGALYKTADSQKTSCWGGDYSKQVSDAPATIMSSKNAYIYPAFQSTLTQAEPVANTNISAESATKITATASFASMMIMMLYA